MESKARNSYFAVWSGDPEEEPREVLLLIGFAGSLSYYLLSHTLLAGEMMLRPYTVTKCFSRGSLKYSTFIKTKMCIPFLRSSRKSALWIKLCNSLNSDKRKFLGVGVMFDVLRLLSLVLRAQERGLWSTRQAGRWTRLRFTELTSSVHPESKWGRACLQAFSSGGD